MRGCNYTVILALPEGLLGPGPWWLFWRRGLPLSAARPAAGGDPVAKQMKCAVFVEPNRIVLDEKPECVAIQGNMADREGLLGTCPRHVPRPRGRSDRAVSERCRYRPSRPKSDAADIVEQGFVHRSLSAI